MKILLMLLWGGALSFSLGARAQYGNWSALEREAMDPALEHYSLSFDAQPYNKRIGKIYVWVLSPFTSSVPLFQALNKAHVNTKPHIVQSWLLFKVGDRYQEELVEQSVQELSNSLYRSVVVIAPVRSQHTASNEVELLVVTRDIWSLVADAGLGLTGSVLNKLRLDLVDNNLLGNNQQLGIFASLSQALIGGGAYYSNPLLADTRHVFDTEQSFYLHKQTGKWAGWKGTVHAGYPLYAPSVSWGYDASLSYSQYPIYDYEGDHLRQVTVMVEGEPLKVERKYNWLELDVTGTVVRSFGCQRKNDLFWGYGALLQRPSLLGAENFSPVLQKAIGTQVLPLKEFQSYWILGYHYYWNEFVSLYNYNTYSVSEIYRSGPDVKVETDFALSPVLWSDNNFIRSSLKASYVWYYWKNSLWSTTLKLEGRLQKKEWINNFFTLSSVFATPDLGPGRWVFRFLVEGYVNDKNNYRFSLGGNTALRGVTSGLYSGSFLGEGNIEYRSKSFSLLGVELGGVLFYDVGVAFNDFHHIPKATQDIGAGVRILFIQFARYPIRIDVAIPVYGPLMGPRYITPTIGFSQAF